MHKIRPGSGRRSREEARSIERTRVRRTARQFQRRSGEDQPGGTPSMYKKKGQPEPGKKAGARKENRAGVEQSIRQKEKGREKPGKCPKKRYHQFGPGRGVFP